MDSCSQPGTWYVVVSDILAIMLTGHQGPGEKIHVASDLGSSADKLTYASRDAREWLLRNAVLASLMAAFKACMFPEQYAIDRETLVRLAKRGATLETVLEKWPFAFTSVAAVSNRSAAEHRDRRSGANWSYDVMATVGGDCDVTIEFKGIGFTGRYDSGAMVITPCHTHMHSVSDSPEKERIAFAAYMKPAVLLDVGLDLPRLPSLSLIKSLHAQRIETGKR